jgi:hypothetical protein
MPDQLRRSMFHHPESEITTQTIKLPLFPSGCLFYVAFKMEQNSVQLTIHHKQGINQVLNLFKDRVITTSQSLVYIV